MNTNTNTGTDKIALRLRAQIVEMKSELNRHAARVKFGKSDDELVSNNLAEVYTDSQRAKEMGELFSDENYAATANRLGKSPEELPPLECLQALWDTFQPSHPAMAKPLLLDQPA